MHDIVVFLDDDCRPHPQWLASFAAGFDEHIGFATGRVVADRSRRLPTSVLLTEQAATWTRPDDATIVGHAANMAVRRQALEAVGGFDEQLGAGASLRGAEDKDLFARLLAAGWHGRYLPDAVVTHVQWRTDRQAVFTFYGYGMGDGALAVKRARLAGVRVTTSVRSAIRAALRDARGDMRAGYQSGAAAHLLRALGVVRGAAKARRHSIDANGRFLRSRGIARR